MVGVSDRCDCVAAAVLPTLLIIDIERVVYASHGVPPTKVAYFPLPDQL